MKNFITMNNALRYYNSNELVSDCDSYKEKFSDDMNALTYNEMLNGMRRKYFLPSWLTKNN